MKKREKGLCIFSVLPALSLPQVNSRSTAFDWSVIKTMTVMYDLGVLFDVGTLLSVRQHVYRLSQTCFCQLRCLRSARFTSFRHKLQTVLFHCYCIRALTEIHHLSSSRLRNVNQLQLQLHSDCQFSVAVQYTVSS